MSDIIVERQTYILVSDADKMMYPANDLYPADDLYPAEMTKLENIVMGTMNISEILCQNELAFGQLYATKFEVQVYDTEDMSGKYIHVIQQDGAGYYFIFSGIIDSCKLDRVGTDRTIVAYDLAYKNSYVNVASWWTTFWSTRETATLKQIRESLLNEVGIIYINKQLMNDNVVIKKAANITSMPFSTMLKMICELSCCFPHFNRQGTLEFIVLDDTAYTEIEDEDYEGENSTFEEYTTDEITGIQFYKSGGEIRYTSGTTVNPYSISDNLLVFGISDTDLITVGTNMLNYMQDIVYTPASIKLIISSFNINVGDYVKTDVGEFYVFENSYSNSQLIDQTISASSKQTMEQVGVDFSTGETMTNEAIIEVTDNVDDAYEVMGDTIDALDENTEDLIVDRRHIEEGDEYVLSVVASATGEEVWDTSGYNFTEDNSGYEDPTAEHTQIPVWSNQGFTIEDTTDGRPIASNYNLLDVGKYYMDETTGNIYQLKKYGIKKYGRIRYLAGNQVLMMHLERNGVASSYEYDWDIYPDVSVGSYYLNCESGQIFQLTKTGNVYSWTLVKQCDKVIAQMQTRIEQTATDITLEATRAEGEETRLAGLINVNASNIELRVQKNDVINQINLSTEGITIDGAKINITGNTTFNATASTASSAYSTASSAYSTASSASSSVSSLSSGLSNGTTTINGGCITTGTIDASRVSVTNLNASNITSGKMSVSNLTSGAMSSNSYIAIGSQNANTTISYNRIKTDFVEPTTGELDVGSYNQSTSLNGSSLYFYIGGTQMGVFNSSGFQADKIRVTDATEAASSSSANVHFTTNNWLQKISSSSKRYKHSITIKLNKKNDPHNLYNLPVKGFVYNEGYLGEDDERKGKQIPGFIAEDVEKYYPIACDHKDTTGEVEDWNVRYVVPPMLALIQEQNKRIEALEDKIKQLEGGN